MTSRGFLLLPNTPLTPRGSLEDPPPQYREQRTPLSLRLVFSGRTRKFHHGDINDGEPLAVPHGIEKTDDVRFFQRTFGAPRVVHMGAIAAERCGIFDDGEGGVRYIPPAAAADETHRIHGVVLLVVKVPGNAAAFAAEVHLACTPTLPSGSTKKSRKSNSGAVFLN